MLRGYLVFPRDLYLGLALLGSVCVAVLYALDPRETGNYPVCVFLTLTGCYCPGCGTLRALHRLLYGDFVTALGYNSLVVLSLPVIAYSYATGALRACGMRAPRPISVHAWWTWALLAGAAAFWVLRNLPIDPLTALAP